MLDKLRDYFGDMMLINEADALIGFKERELVVFEKMGTSTSFVAQLKLDVELGVYRVRKATLEEKASWFDWGESVYYL